MILHICTFVCLSAWVPISVHLCVWLYRGKPAHLGSVHVTARLSPDWHVVSAVVPAEELSLMSGGASALKQQLSQAQQHSLDQQLQIQR